MCYEIGSKKVMNEASEIFGLRAEMREIDNSVLGVKTKREQKWVRKNERDWNWDCVLFI